MTAKIALAGVTKRFGSKVVLNGVDLDVAPGESMVIIGGSGTGKSVLLRTILGLRQPTSGSVKVEGVDVTGADDDHLRAVKRRYGVAFQNGALFSSLTVGENVAFPLRERGDLNEEETYQIIDGLLEMVGVKEMRDLLPSDLSTGMKRSVAIARALAAQPEAVLYDEPTTMVEPSTAFISAFCRELVR